MDGLPADEGRIVHRGIRGLPGYPRKITCTSLTPPGSPESNQRNLMRYDRSGSTVCPLKVPSKRPSSGCGSHVGQYTGAWISFASFCQLARDELVQTAGVVSTAVAADGSESAPAQDVTASTNAATTAPLASTTAAFPLVTISSLYDTRAHGPRRGAT